MREGGREGGREGERFMAVTRRVVPSVLVEEEGRNGINALV